MNILVWFYSTDWTAVYWILLRVTYNFIPFTTLYYTTYISVLVFTLRLRQLDNLFLKIYTKKLCEYSITASFSRITVGKRNGIAIWINILVKVIYVYYCFIFS